VLENKAGCKTLIFNREDCWKTKRGRKLCFSTEILNRRLLEIQAGAINLVKILFGNWNSNTSDQYRRGRVFLVDCPPLSVS
jgi:hypothetical protein